MDLSGIKVAAIAIVLLVAGIGAGFAIGFGIYQPKISNLEGQNSQLQSQVSDLEGNVTGLQSQISTLQTNITELQAYITELEEQRPHTWDDIVERGYIRVACSPDWPPFEYLEAGEFAGFEVDILEEVMSRLSAEEGVTITVDWVEMDFGSIKEAVVAKTVDLGVSGFSVTPERWEAVQFCTPHSVAEAQIIALNTTAATVGMLESIANLTDYGLSCGVEAGTTQEEELIAAGITPMVYVDYLAAMDDLVAGGVDTVYTETPITYYFISEYAKQGYDIDVIFAKPSWPVAFIAHHDSDVLVAKISGVIAELISEGWIEELAEDYGMVY